jgi:hypothetical protein
MQIGARSTERAITLVKLLPDPAYHRRIKPNVPPARAVEC